MAALAINSGPDATTWYAQILNSGMTEYQFVNYDAINELATAMKAGRDAVIALFQAAKTFINQVVQQAEVMFQRMFGTTVKAFFQGQVFAEAAQSWDTLENTIAEVGQALLDLLGALAETYVKAGKGDPRDLKVNTQRPSGLVWKRVSDTAPDMSQTWSNLSNQSFLVTYGYDNPLSNPITAPITPLKPGSTTTLSWYQGFGAWTQTCDGWIVLTGTDGISFGINLHVPPQVFSIGASPYYQVWQGTGTPDWGSSQKLRAAGYTFQGLSCGPVQVMPTDASQTSLLLQITIPQS
ncbi:hypothetical protein FRC12_014929 [Ceratobasidium sp. 428]|nr:hypothetical protein FRC12_014929 [Ceratobasidium sp. 428]